MWKWFLKRFPRPATPMKNISEIVAAGSVFVAGRVKVLEDPASRVKF
jgi:hypothetical protein